jgi:hypothetical protein
MPNRRARRQRDKQAGRAILRLLGDRGEILFPDRGQQPMKIHIPRHQDRRTDGFGSHADGRHKLG